jgi:hypothetical protein
LVANPDVAAVFGSYTAHAGTSGFFTAYKNYVHHFTHQTASPKAFTFWTGCGFVRRTAFDQLDGFDAGQRFLSDVEFGYRMHLAGLEVRIEKSIQVVHHKRYDFAGLVRSDLFGRAIPWTRLMMRHRTVKQDLNLRPENVFSVPLSFGILFVLLAGPAIGSVMGVSSLRTGLGTFLVAAGGWGILAILNRRFFGFVRSQAGRWFALRTVFLQWFIYLVSGLGLVAALLGARSGGR